MIGKLPDSHWFAGRYLNVPLSGYKLHRCRRCQLKFKHPLLDAASYQQLYDNAAISTWPADTTRPDWDLIIDYISTRLPQGGRVLDFGCYTGGLLTRLGSAYERYGVEINHTAANVASNRLSRHIWSSIAEIPGDLRFDVVVVSDVLEHLANPLTLINELAALLDDEGVLTITTGDADNRLWNRFGANWWYCFYPEHVAFVSETWLGYMSRTTGLTVVCCKTFYYCRKGPIIRIVDAVLTYCYGWFPIAYLRVVGRLKKMLGRRAMTSVPGSGVTADHLFVVLASGLKHED
jgi:SAM-dependent methyltransferase